MDDRPVRLLNLIHCPDDDCAEVERVATRLTEVALRGGHAERAELMRDLNDASRFVMLLEFASEARLRQYFADPERLQILDDVATTLHEGVERLELAPVEVAARR